MSPFFFLFGEWLNYILVIYMGSFFDANTISGDCMVGMNFL
jgi:hypothetical protein